jgi:hypothetical protein
MNNGDLESRGKRDVLFVRPCPQRPNRGRLYRRGIRMGCEQTYKQRKLKWLRQSMSTELTHGANQQRHLGPGV